MFRLTLGLKADCTNQTILPLCNGPDSLLCQAEYCTQPGVPAACPETCGLCRQQFFRKKRDVNSVAGIKVHNEKNVAASKTVSTASVSSDATCKYSQ